MEEVDIEEVVTEDTIEELEPEVMSATDEVQLIEEIVVLPLGRFMASWFPRKDLWGFSLNPGPFTMKEHAFITIFDSFGSGAVHAVGIFTIGEAFYKRHMNRPTTWLLAITTQLLQCNGNMEALRSKWSPQQLEKKQRNCNKSNT